MRLSAHGIGIDVPRGWDARITRAPDAAVSSPHAPGLATAAIPQSGYISPVLHLANFALPELRGDYGSGAVERMRSTNVFAALVEFGPESVGSALFSAQGMPTFRPREFTSSTMQRPLGSLGGAQRFFTLNNRAFCLYVVVGSVARRSALCQLANGALTRVSIT